MNYHHYCSNFLAKRSSSSLEKYANCGYDLAITDNKRYFIEFPIANQLKSFFKKKDFYENLQYTFNCKKKKKGNLEDIYDGEIYLKHFKDNGFLSNKDNISFLWNTDGVPLVFKSSKVYIWPLFLVITELEPSLWYKSENMVFAGIWYRTRKPEPTLFLEPLYREFEIMEKGILVDIPTETSGNISKLIKGVLIAGTFDLPARCLVSGSVQFNVKYGFVKFFESVESFKTAGGGNFWIYPFKKNDPSGPNRNNTNFKINALEAYHENKAKFGTKYPT